MTDTTEKESAKIDHSSDSTGGSEGLQDKQETVAAAEPSAEGPVYETGFKLVAILCTIYSTTLLAALDIGIVATAIPGITNDFHKLDDIGWYGAAVFLLAGTTSPVWGKIYTFYSARWSYLVAIFIFLIGSLVAALAPNSIALIVGRAIQGWGIAGTFSGSVLMINFVAPPQQRPMLIGSWMAILMFATIIGPLIGGAFTTNVNWRWCFWINLPVGGVIMLAVLLWFHVPKHIKLPKATLLEVLLQLDLPGFSLLLTSLVCLTLALQWGGLTKAWSDGSVIATLVMWVVLTIAFVVCEYFQKSRAMMPLAKLRPRIAWTLTLYALIVNISCFQIQFYLPLYFQSVQGQSAVKSGINCLPFVAFFALASIVSGGLVQKTKLLHPYLLASGLLGTAGVALLYTLDVNSSKARYIGPQVLAGFGVGLGCQIPMMAIQSLTPPRDIPTMSSIIVMGNTISGAYFVTAAQSVFGNRMLQALASNAPNIDGNVVLNTGASQLQLFFSGTDLIHVLDAYMVGIKDVFAFSLAGTAFCAVLTLAVPFIKLPDHGHGPPQPDAGAAKDSPA